MLRQSTDEINYASKAKFAISRYEDNLNYSRTRLDLDLAHDIFDDTNIMTLLSNKSVGISNNHPQYTLDINGNLNIGLDDNNYKFKYILIRNRKNSLQTVNYTINLTEIQCWINNTNICQNTGVTSNYVIENNSQFTTTTGHSSLYPSSNLINNSISDFVFTQDNSSHHLLINLNSIYNFNDLQGIIIYNSNTGEYNANRFKDIKVELLDENYNLISYIDPETTINDIYKYKGPSYTTYPINTSIQTFSSTNMIYDLENNMKIYDYYSDVSSQQFKGKTNKIIRFMGICINI